MYKSAAQLQHTQNNIRFKSRKIPDSFQQVPDSGKVQKRKNQNRSVFVLQILWGIHPEIYLELVRDLQ